nr:hypothetical protein [Erwinia sp. Ejp617]
MLKTLPVKYSQTEANPLELMSEIQQLIPKIETDLVGSLDWYSPDARYVPDTIRMISLEHLGQSRYKMNYSFCWNLFNACLDIDANETIKQSVNFSYRPNELIFDFVDNHRQMMSDEL